MKPLTPQEAQSPMFKKALKELSGKRQTSAVDHLRRIEKDKEGLPPRQNRVVEIDTKLEQVTADLQKLKGEFLKMSNNKQQKTVVEIVELERKQDTLQKERTKTQGEMSQLKVAIENHKRALDDIRRQEHEFRQRQVERQKQELQDKINRDKARKFKTENYIPIRNKLLQPITVANFDEIKGLINRWPSLNEWVAEFGDEDVVANAYPNALLKQARRRVIDFSRDRELFEQKT